MVERWDRARQERPDERLVMLTDASNAELDRINARAQEQRAQAGELGGREVELPDRPYGLAAGDEVIFTAALYPPASSASRTARSGGSWTSQATTAARSRRRVRRSAR